jgi:dihydrofolate reductase
MGKLIVSQFITIDGVVEDPGGSENLERGGWALAFDRGPAGDQFKLDELMAADALLLGRVTYEGFAAAWPEREGEFADKFNTMAKYVVTSTLKNPDWNNTTVSNGNLEKEVTRLKQEISGDILVNGSVQLTRELVERGLVDELRLMVFPTVLGAGKRLFDDTAASIPMRLVDAKSAGETFILIYTPER